jgi:hypothetical protein
MINLRRFDLCFFRRVKAPRTGSSQRDENLSEGSFLFQNICDFTYVNIHATAIHTVKKFEEISCQTAAVNEK